MRPERIYAADLLRALACLFIFHYHCNTFLPGEWKFLTLFGQDLGNDLFFMISGFTLYGSIQGTDFGGFPSWAVKRLKRILPMLFVAYAAAALTGYYSFRDPRQLFTVLVYPTLYWFVSAIIVFYLLLFFLVKAVPFSARIGISLILFAGYCLLGDRAERLYVIGFLSMLLGFMIREWAERREGSGRNGLWFLLLLLGLAVYGAGKWAGRLPVTALGVLWTGISALLLGLGMNAQLREYFEKHVRLYAVVRWIGLMALPVYLVQCFRAGEIGFWIGQNIDFPWSYPVNLILVWTAASLLYFLDSILQKAWAEGGSNG